VRNTDGVEITELAMPVPDPADDRPAFMAHDGASAILTLTLHDAGGRRAEAAVEVQLFGR